MATHQTFFCQNEHLSGQIKFDQTNLLLYIAYHLQWQIFAVSHLYFHSTKKCSRLPTFTNFYDIHVQKFTTKPSQLQSNLWKTQQYFITNNKQYTVYVINGNFIKFAKPGQFSVFIISPAIISKLLFKSCR